MHESRNDYERMAREAFDEGDHRAAARCIALSAEARFRTARAAPDPTAAARSTDEGFELLDLATALARFGDEPVDERSGPDLSGPWTMEERPSVRFEDVVGMDEVAELVRSHVVDAERHPRVHAKYGLARSAGVLLYGPPGTGKTWFARAVAGELDAAFFAVDCASIKDKWVGETAKNVGRLFAAARAARRAVVFIDEAENLLRRRGDHHVDAVTQFLTELGGIAQHDGTLVVLAATNRPQDIDEAVLRPGRLGTHVFVGLPDAAARGALFGMMLEGVPVAADIQVAELARRAEGFSGAEIRQVVDDACRRAARREIAELDGGASASDGAVTAADLAAALALLQPRTSRAQLDELRAWAAGRAGEVNRCGA